MSEIINQFVAPIETHYAEGRCVDGQSNQLRTIHFYSANYFNREVCAAKERKASPEDIGGLYLDRAIYYFSNTGAERLDSINRCIISGTEKLTIASQYLRQGGRHGVGQFALDGHIRVLHAELLRAEVAEFWREDPRWAEIVLVKAAAELVHFKIFNAVNEFHTLREEQKYLDQKEALLTSFNDLTIGDYRLHTAGSQEVASGLEAKLRICAGLPKEACRDFTLFDEDLRIRINGVPTDDEEREI